MTATNRCQCVSDSCQLRPDIALIEPDLFNNFNQLSRGSFAASVRGRIETDVRLARGQKQAPGVVRGFRMRTY